jgi:hypothetical protein
VPARDGTQPAHRVPGWMGPSCSGSATQGGLRAGPDPMRALGTPPHGLAPQGASSGLRGLLETSDSGVTFPKVGWIPWGGGFVLCPMRNSSAMIPVCADGTTGLA